MSDKPTNVYDALRQVSDKIEFIAKDRTAQAGGTFKYRGIEDVLRAVHGPFIEYGIVCIPRVMQANIVPHDVPKFDKNGAPAGTRREYEAQMMVEYTF